MDPHWCRLCVQVSLLVVALSSSGVFCLRGNQEPRGFERQQTSASSLVPNLEDVSDTKGEASAFLGAGAGAVQAHSKYFQDFFTVQLSPYKLEYGHTCENPDDWEQRYERKDLKNHRDQGKVTRSYTFSWYAHVPHKDHYEVGHRKGNEHHFTERHEKAHPHAGEFKTKVRWGDKHGGYGEHYWDFNHAGHGGDDSHDEGSEQVSDYEQLTGSPSREKRQPKQSSEESEGNPPEQLSQASAPSGDKSQPEQVVELPKRARWQPSENTKRTKWQPEQSTEIPNRNKRQQKDRRQKIPLLIYDHSTGQVKDQVTGKVFNLQPASQ